VFDASYLDEGASSRTRVVIGRIKRVIAFFSGHIERQYRPACASTSGAGSGGCGGSNVAHKSRVSKEGISKSVEIDVASMASTARTIGISVDRVFDVIDRFARMLPRDVLGSLPELRFEYCEADMPDLFFLPYAWVLAMRNSPLSWDPAQFPDACVALATSVFHPPRPMPCGTSVPQRG
jgi:hypothetical protein